MSILGRFFKTKRSVVEEEFAQQMRDRYTADGQAPDEGGNHQDGHDPAEGESAHLPPLPNYGQPENKSRATIQITIALLVAAVPLLFYFSQTDSFQNTVSTISGEKPLPVSSFNKSTVNNSKKSFSSKSRPPGSGASNSAKSSNMVRVADSGRSSEPVASVMDDTAVEHAGKHANPKYVCPMHSSVIDDDPNAICPICGMDLVLIESGGDAGVVNLTPNVINSLGVRTAKVKRRTLYRRIDSVGYINIDENNLRSMSLRTDGWLEKLAVKSEGERVTKGQLLFEIYSPKLVNAQEEYMQAMEHQNALMLTASRERLNSLGVSEEQVSELEETGKVEQLVKVFAPQSGIVSALRAREGVYVKPSQAVMDLVDLSSVWLIVDVFERQADWVKVGQRAEASLPFKPGKSWEGKVEYVYPSLDALTRSLKVRLRFDNADEELKPNMYADVKIFAKPKRKVLAIPKEAVIRTGTQTRVIVALGEGRFVPVQVNIGMETNTKIEITSGINEGDEVVTSSQFLIDSESSMKAGLARMTSGGS